MSRRDERVAISTQARRRCRGYIFEAENRTMTRRTFPNESEPGIFSGLARYWESLRLSKCASPIVQETVVVGEICHIKAASPQGPRYDPGQTARGAPRVRQSDFVVRQPSYDHRRRPEAYTVERLIKMKAYHEDRSTALTEEEVDIGVRVFANQAVRSDNQSADGSAPPHPSDFSIYKAQAELPPQEEQRQAEKLQQQT